jgi:hypothetical protein
MPQRDVIRGHKNDQLARSHRHYCIEVSTHTEVLVVSANYHPMWPGIPLGDVSHSLIGVIARAVIRQYDLYRFALLVQRTPYRFVNVFGMVVAKDRQCRPNGQSQGPEDMRLGLVAISLTAAMTMSTSDRLCTGLMGRLKSWPSKRSEMGSGGKQPESYAGWR